VVLTCNKSRDSANLAIGHLEIKTGFRHRYTRRAIFDLTYKNAFFNGMLYIARARSESVRGGGQFLIKLTRFAC
jgi:hypothetical protein